MEDEARTGRPNEVVHEGNIAAVCQMIEDDPRVTYSIIQASLAIHPPQIHTILHDHLCVTKRTPRWVPRMLTAQQKAARVDWCHFMIEKFNNGASRAVENIITGDETWVYQYEPERKQQSQVWMFEGDELPVKSRRTRSAGKRMALTFFSMRGQESTSVLENRRTVNAEWYCNIGLSDLFRQVREKRPRSGMRNMIFHHDNAPAHTAARTAEFLTTNGINPLPHPAYSPDLAPADYFLFPKVKDSLRGRQFADSEEAMAAYEAAIQSLPRSAFEKCFSDWFIRMHKCIVSEGAYFEKL